jgi:hypothetical protein
MSETMDWEGEVLDRWAEGEGSAMLEVEYWQVVQMLQGFSERDARQHAAPGLPSVLELASELAVEELPNGPAPSLSDTLHALDRAFAGWQAESEPFQRTQARRLVLCLGQLTMLRRMFATDERDGE